METHRKQATSNQIYQEPVLSTAAVVLGQADSYSAYLSVFVKQAQVVFEFNCIYINVLNC